MITYGLPNNDYHAHEAISTSKLHIAARSHAHLHHELEHPEDRKETAAMAFGTAVHCAVLEPDDFLKHYEIEPPELNKRTKEGRGFVAQKKEKGIILLTQEEFDACLKIRDKVHWHPIVGNPLRKNIGVAESSIFGKCPITGLQIKCRPDYLISNLGSIFDLKTTLDARPRAFANSVAKYRYHVQEAFYRYVYWCALDEYLNDFMFIAVEKQPPYEIAVYDLDDEAKLEGERLVQLELEGIARCFETGQWPGYSQEVISLSLPGWAILQNEDNFFMDESVMEIDHGDV